MAKIPKVQIKEAPGVIPKPNFVPKDDDAIVFSFAALEQNEYFNVDKSDSGWTLVLLDLLRNISKYSKKFLITNCSNNTYRVHDQEKANPPCDLPEGIALKDLYQISLGKSKGRIHGVFYENVFYIIWLDPKHNLWPDKNHGGIKIVVPPNDPRDEKIGELCEKVKKQKEEIDAYEQLFNETK